MKEEASEDIALPLTKYQKDIAALQTVYDMNCTGAERDSFRKFWGNTKTRNIVLHDRFGQHLDMHTSSCFKKGDECQNFHPFKIRLNDADLYEDDTAQKVFYHSLDEKVTSENCFTLLLQDVST